MLRNIPLQVGANEVPSPFHAQIVAVREEAERKAAANPKGFDCGGRHFQRIKRAKLQIGNATGQTFAGLPEQIHGR